MVHTSTERFGRYKDKKILKFFMSNKNVPGVIRKYVRKIPLDFIADVEFDGIKFRSYPSQNNHDRAYFYESLLHAEKETFDFIDSHIQNGETFVDIGANTGAITIPVALKYKHLQKIVAIEPDPDSMNRFIYNAKINTISNIVAVDCAVGASSGEVTLWRNDKTNSGGNSIYHYYKTGIPIPVQIKPLLDVVREAGLDHIGVLKIDVEGYEDQALMPFFRTAPRSLWPKAIIMEHIFRQVWKEDCINWMKANGYCVEDMTKDNIMLVLAES